MIKIIEKEGHFIAISSIDNSIQIGKTLEEAYSKSKSNNSNENLDLSKLDHGIDTIDMRGNLKLFFIKLFSVLILFFIITFILIQITSSYLDDNITKLNNKFDNFGGSRFWSKIEREIISSANENNSISQEKQEQILKALKIHVQNLKPFMNEINELFEED